MTLDCRTYSACCTALGTRAPFVRLLSGEDYPETITDARGRRCLRVVGDRCIYLDGEPGREVACRVHERRPRVCASFEVGGKACVAARSLLGIG